MKRIIYTTLVVCCSIGITSAQSIEDVLSQIEQNNKMLQVEDKANEAAKIGIDAENSLTDPSVTYSSFYSKGVEGQAGSEMVVSQGFDFPTLYSNRKQAGRDRKAVIDFNREALRRNTLLEAQKLCFDIIRLNKEKEILTKRQQNATELLSLFELRLKAGDATIIEVNKIKMERMSIQTAMLQNSTALQTAMRQLVTMNSDRPISFNANEYPSSLPNIDFENAINEILANDAEILTAEANKKAMRQELKVTHHNWLPKFEIGYRRNTSEDTKQHGFVVGGFIPIFSNRKHVKIAQATAVGANLTAEEVRLRVCNSAYSTINEARQMQEAMSIYDVSLMKETLMLLKEGVEAGQVSIIDYFTEADEIYRNMESYIEVENRYHKAIATLYKWKL